MRKKTIICVMFSVVILLGAMFILKNNTVSYAATKVDVNIDGKNFTATLNDNTSAKAFTKHLPESFNMLELSFSKKKSGKILLNKTELKLVKGKKYKCRVTVVDNNTSTEDIIKEDKTMVLLINDTEVEVLWEDNESVRELEKMAEDKDISIAMSGYGGFEQVGSLGTSITRNDVQMTTSSGDIVLYSGSNIVLFYGSNSWSYTKLGKVINKSDEELAELLSGSDIVITLKLR